MKGEKSPFVLLRPELPAKEPEKVEGPTMHITFDRSEIAYDRRWIFNLDDAVAYAIAHPDVEVIYVHKLADEFVYYDVRELEEYAAV